MAIIELDHVSKEFELGEAQTLRVGVRGIALRMMGRQTADKPMLKALDDVDFDVAEGEVVGIIGHNGAGKSTLLKILSRITVPSQGRVHVRGRVAPLIEVGAGLVGDLTGRENIFLNATILGMSRKAIRRRFDEIVTFSELEQFLDTPVKRYSSGMSVRLGFSIATSIDADILIVDEVLAVGDLAFQRKCFDRMEQLIARDGKTVLLVSHNVRQVERVCKRAILLDRGRVVSDGQVTDVCNQYYEIMDSKVHAQATSSGLSETANRVRSTGVFRLHSLTLLDEAGSAVTEIEQGGTVVAQLIGENTAPLRSPVFAIGIHTTDFIYLATARSASAGAMNDIAPGRFVVSCTIEDIPLLPGTYALRVSVAEGGLSTTVFYAENLSPFRIRNDTLQRSMIASEGLFALRSSWSKPEPLRTPGSVKPYG